MSIIRYGFLLSIVLFCVLVPAQQVKIEKIEPPNWWTGMKLNKLQLMVYGENLQDVSVSIEPGSILVHSVKSTESGHYSFIDIEIPQETDSQTYKIILSKNGTRTIKEFPIFRRETGVRHQGFSTADIIYLIMPDRFANGDESNDKAPGFMDNPDRTKLDGRHGGGYPGNNKQSVLS